MTNCCDEYGDCPVRTGKVLPHQAAHARAAKRIEISTIGCCDSRLDWPDTVPPEAGNVRLPPVDNTDGVPLSYAETMELVRLMIYLVLGVIVFFGGLGLLVSYGTERWPDALWAFLAGLS